MAVARSEKCKWGRSAAPDNHDQRVDGDADFQELQHPERAIAFLDYLMSEHGAFTHLGVEGVTYDIKDGKPVLRDNIKQILDTDRAAYDREYGADDAYWMLQDNVMQLQWKQEPSPATAQLEEWGRKYVVYNGQYDVYLDPAR